MSSPLTGVLGDAIIAGVLNPSAVDGFLFDLDGTLLDSDDQAVEALARGLRRLGFVDPYVAARRLVMALETPGNAVMTALDALGLDAALSAVRRWVKRLGGVRQRSEFLLVGESDQALHLLSQRYRLAVVTTRGREDAEAFLEQFDLRSLFEVIVTRESTWRIKPHPQPVLHATELLDLPPERCVMVGDTVMDIRAARRAGAWAVAVLCGFGERDELERAGAHLVLPSPSELPHALGLSDASDG